MWSRYQAYKQQWKDCKKCSLHKTRLRIVHCRGKLPCDIFFLGEAPGDSENLLGRPFVGPAGKLLDRIIAKAVGSLDLRMAFGNLLGCIPFDDEGKKVKHLANHKAAMKWVEACRPRLHDLLRIANPDLLVYVGKMAAAHSWMGETKDRRVISIVHPSAILQTDIMQRGLLIQRTIVDLEEAIQENFGDDIPS